MPGRRKGITFRDAHVHTVRILKELNLPKSKTTMADGSSNAFSGLLEPRGRVGFFLARVYFKKGLLGKGKERAQNVFLKSIPCVSLQMRKEEAKRQAAVLTDLRLKGLPAPRAGAVFVEGDWYLALSPYLRKGGTKTKLIPINTKKRNPLPFFLRDLSYSKHEELISLLGRDTALILNQGYSARHFDFFAFYVGKDKKLHYVITDVGELVKTSDKYPGGMIGDIRKVIDTFSQRRKWLVFRHTLLANITDFQRREAVRQMCS